MSYYIAIYDWSLYTLPGSIPLSDIQGDSHSNDPASLDYTPTAPTWIGETFTYNGGSSTFIEISDDDANFEDGYVEVGVPSTLTEDVTINGTTYLAGSQIQNEFGMTDASGNEVWVIRINGDNIGFAYPVDEDPTPGQTFTGSAGSDGDPSDGSTGESSTVAYQGIICFTPGTLIETPDGLQAVETLKVNDIVMTIDSGPQPIRWVSNSKISCSGELEHGKPIQIKADAFGPGLPNRDLVVSPQHRFLFHDNSGASDVEVFVAAKALTVLPHVRVLEGKKSIQYIHIALERHEVIMAEGVFTESCYLGPVMLQDIPKRHRPQMKAIFPKIGFNPGRGYGPTARPELRVQRSRKLLKARQLIYQPAPVPLGKDFPMPRHFRSFVDRNHGFSDHLAMVSR